MPALEAPAHRSCLPPQMPGSRKRVIFAEGHDLRILRAIQGIVEARSAIPIVVGQEKDIRKRISEANIGLRAGHDLEIVEPNDEFECFDQWLAYSSAQQLKWSVPDLPLFIRDSRNTASAARLVAGSHADCVICGTSGEFAWHFVQLKETLASLQRRTAGMLHLLFAHNRLLCLSDVLIDGDANPSQLAEVAVTAAQHVSAIGARPKIALCLDRCGKDISSQGDRLHAAAQIVKTMAAEIDVDGPVALKDAMGVMSGRRAQGTSTSYNVLVFSRAGIATTVRDVLRSNSDWSEFGPLLLGTENRAHIVTPEISSEALIDMAAFAGKRLDEAIPAVGSTGHK
ncbi:phosphate acyltransferase [Rhizobium sp. J15]|uniref:phosphate acyltransferase n=1 Tax=Rhizobium sp. J15 TaxID=2035450 RepID=UPI001596CB36|nr:phosphate acyltransferase [Rhizobium sp. J15]